MRHHSRPRVLNAWDLPAALPDELGISVVARYLKDWSYLDSRRLANRELGLGSRLACPAISAPINLLKYGAETLRRTIAQSTVWNQTLLPYYLSFRTAQDVEISLQRLERGQRCFDLLRLVSVDKPRHLRFCVACFAQDVSTHGEAYWHRSHQLPAVADCWEHRCALQDSTVPYDGLRWYELTPPDDQNCAPSNCPATRRLLTGTLAAFVATESLRALNRKSRVFGYVPQRSLRRILRQLGYESKADNVAATRLVADFQDWAITQKSDLLLFGPEGWWLGLFNATRTRPTHVQALIFRRFLQGRWSSLVEQMSFNFPGSEE